MRIMWAVVLLLWVVAGSAQQYRVSVIQRDSQPKLSYLVTNNSAFKQVFNPAWVPPSPATQGKAGLLIRTQNCDFEEGKCIFCGGGANKASIMTYSLQQGDSLTPVTADSVAFVPSSFEDSWGTEDPRVAYSPSLGLYYMMYTAYNGSSILLSLARAADPFSQDSWTKLGPVFPSFQNSKSGALLIREVGPHYLFWGDSSIRVARSNDLQHWPQIGQIWLSPRSDHFDSRLVESGPPPLRLSDGNYLFFYNSAEQGWPEDSSTSYNVGWVVLAYQDPTQILARSDTPLLTSKEPWEKGEKPFLCNVPRVVFVAAAEPLGQDRFRLFFGGGDATIGSAVVQVTLTSLST